MGWVRVRRSFKEAALAAMILLRDHSSWYLDISMSRRRRQRLAASDVVTERSRAQAYTSPGPSRCVEAGCQSPRTWTGARCCPCPADAAPCRHPHASSWRSGATNSCRRPPIVKVVENASVRLHRDRIGQGRRRAAHLLDDTLGRWRESHLLDVPGGRESRSSFTQRPIWTSRLCAGEFGVDAAPASRGSVPGGGAGAFR